MSESDMDHGFCRGGADLVVFRESVRPGQPGEGMLDDPALRQYAEPVLFAAFDDFHLVTEHVFCPVDQLARRAAIGDGDNGSTLIAPRNGGGGFEASVGELGSGYGTVLAKEANYTRKVLDMRVLPDAEVGGTDAALGDDGGSFGEDGACAPNCASPKVDEMPVVGKAVFAGVLAHGGNGNAVSH